MQFQAKYQQIFFFLLKYFSIPMVRVHERFTDFTSGIFSQPSHARTLKVLSTVWVQKKSQAKKS